MPKVSATSRGCRRGFHGLKGTPLGGSPPSKYRQPFAGKRRRTANQRFGGRR